MGVTDRKKLENIFKKASLLNERNSTNANTQKLKKVQVKLTRIYQKEQFNTKSIILEIQKKIDNHELHNRV